MNKEKIELLEGILDDQQTIYDNHTFEDYGQLINNSGEMEVLDVINVVKDKIRDLEQEDAISELGEEDLG